MSTDAPYSSSFRNMRLIVMFDLPTITSADRRAYTQFKRSLDDDGFVMMQFSVYSRFCKNDQSAQKHIARVKSFSPGKGNIRIIAITEKQYEEMVMVIGEKHDNETIINNDYLIVLE